MASVTGIQERKGIVELSVDGQRFARIRAEQFHKFPLEMYEAIDPEAYLDQIAGEQFAECYEAALTRLDFSARTAAELKRALLQKGFVEPAVNAAIAKLTEIHLIDDAAIAGRMAESAAAPGSAVGKYAFKRKLRARGMSDEDVEDALNTMTDEQQADAALLCAQKIFRRYAACPPREGKAKLSQALARRGFSWDAIAQAVGKTIGDDADDEI